MSRGALNKEVKGGAKLQRLIEMSPREIGYRLYKELAFRFDRWRVGHKRPEISDQEIMEAFNLPWFDIQPELSYQTLRRYLCESVAPRFFFNPIRRGEYARYVRAQHPEWVESARAQADLICTHRIPLLGLGEIQIGDAIDWHCDPQTGRRWPKRHWLDIPIASNEATGDPKVIWELNRHQHLVWLGLAYCYTEDESYVNEFIYQIESWIEQNPCQIGINWASSLEIAFRAINWFWSLFFFINSPRLPTALVVRMMKSLTQHLDAIAHNPSIYSSPNTHLTGEVCALYIGALIFAEHKRAARWRKFAEQVLKQEIERQLYKDGGHKEQSAYYHCYTVEFYLLAVALMRRNGITVDSAIWQGLERACEYLMHICQPGRELAAFGDEDGGKALMIGTRSYRHPADLLASAAIIYNRGDFKQCAGQLPEATLWLMGSDARTRFDSIAAHSPRQCSTGFSAAGHVALRADWSTKANYLLFHCPGRTPLAGHRHDDSLSFELASGGRLRLIDSGTYRYNGCERARRHFRGTSAHNTVRIDGLDHSQSSDTFKWARLAEARLLQTIFSAPVDYAAGEQNGYMSLPNPCLHRRAVLFARPDYFVLFDEFKGHGEHDFESFFHCGEAQIEQTVRGWLRINYDDGERLLIVPIARDQLMVELLPDSDCEGWRSRAYGHKERCLSIKLQQRSAVPREVITLLIPFRDQEPSVEAVKTDNGLCAHINYLGSDDYIMCARGAGSQRFGAISFTGERLWLRARGGVARAVFALDASHIQFHNRVILQNPSNLPHYIWTGSDEQEKR